MGCQNGFAYVLTFFLIISDGLVGVIRHTFIYPFKGWPCQSISKSASSYNCFPNWNENLENGPCRSHNGFMVGFIKFPSEIKKMLLQKNTFSLIINRSHLYPFGPDILSYCQTRHPPATVPCIIISHDNILRSQELLSVIGVKEIFWPRRFKAVIQRTGQLSLGTMADFSFILPSRMFDL